MRVLVLGGTTEASLLARALAGRPGFAAELSLAGRTAAPATQPLPTRIGGFGGPEGLSAYLRDRQVDAVVDATHPFARQMSLHAQAACEATGVPLVAFTRAPWSPRPEDRWTELADAAAAAAALGEEPRTVFLTVGRLSLPAFAAAAQHLYVIRSIDAPEGLDALPRHVLVLARGPFRAADEEALLRAHAVQVLVTKNSGGDATSAKLEAARRLGVPVLMIARPPHPDMPERHDVAGVLDWLEAHRGAP